jgi:hypothetical protein
MYIFSQFISDHVANQEDNSLFLVGDLIPDWVAVPKELGGGRRNPTSFREATCPRCKNHLLTEICLGSNFFVAECQITNRMLWYARKENDNDF